MTQLDTLDVVVLLAILVGTVAYFTKGSLWGKKELDKYSMDYGAPPASPTLGMDARDIIKKMQKNGKNCVIFFGSQTGTAEDYAQRLAKEGSQRFGLRTMLADLEEYDYENLDEWPADCLAFFIMATYGEGEPTDNAVEFYTHISSDDATFASGATADDAPLASMRFVAFGLGNNTYEHYNYMVRNTDKFLRRLGARRIGDAGEGDDGSGTMEEDFLAWKEPMWEAVCREFGLEERESVYEPSFKIEEQAGVTADAAAAADTVYLGEPNKRHLAADGPDGPAGPFNATNPYPAPIAASRELFTAKGRNCIHMEIDISGSTLSYETGDHVAVWPHNAGTEVDRFLAVFGLAAKRDQVIDIQPLDVTAKVPVPTPTTYAAVVRHHLEICGPVSRQFLSSLAPFAPSDAAKLALRRLGSEKEHFSETVTARCLNIAQVLQAVAGADADPFAAVPFSLLLEGIPKIQPRYYSISSSSLAQPKTVSVTAVVESVRVPASDHVLKGVTTNYLLALKNKQHADHSASDGTVDTTTDLAANELNYLLAGPRGRWTPLRVPVHIRHSNFKLPSDPRRPVIMVGPGTGVAPFRGFVQERAEQKKRGEEVGPTVLFFGCRREEEDFLYRAEWAEYARVLGEDGFRLITAFSRAGPQKVYVQHRLREHAALVNELLQKQQANFYVCGDAAHMAREVAATLVDIIAEQRGMEHDKADALVKRMRTSGKYLEDVWS
ncbi:NADPH-cytochrome P450 reductase [Ascosphaera acerosa]|nr:NADPH-cytochrome P450 reductase [Ascosphaera acerosa]